MSFMSAVIDNTAVDQFGAQGNASQLANYSQVAFNRSNEMFNPYSTRNMLLKNNMTEDALNLQAQGNIMNRRNAASFGVPNFAKTALENESLMGKIRNQSTKDFLGNMNQQTQLAQGFSGQAGQFTAQGAGIKNNLNSLFRQQSAANQQAKQKSNAMKFDLFKMVAAPLMGPALGAIGGMAGAGILGAGSGEGFQQGVQQFASNQLNPPQIPLGNPGSTTPSFQSQGFTPNFMSGLGSSLGTGLGNIGMNYLQQQHGGGGQYNLLNQYGSGGQYSDVRLKENIELVGKSNLGVNIYEFDYKDKSYGSKRYRGVMAQEVQKASYIDSKGYLYVDYNKLDVDFKEIA